MAIIGNMTRQEREALKEAEIKKADICRRVLRIQKREGLNTTFKELMALSLDDLKILID